MFIFREPLTGIEPVTSSLPRKCSTPELQRQTFNISTVAFDSVNVVALYSASSPETPGCSTPELQRQTYFTVSCKTVPMLAPVNLSDNGKHSISLPSLLTV